MSKFLSSSFLALAGSASLFLAAPSSADECPDDAEQHVYEMILQIEANEATTPNDVFERIDWAAETCPNRREVQGLAVLLASLAMESTSDAGVVKAAVDRGLHAVRLNSLAPPELPPGPVVVDREDNETNLQTFKVVSDRYLQVVLPKVIQLAHFGEVLPFIDGTPLEACPYNLESSMRLQREANVWGMSISDEFRKDDDPVFGWSTNRLNALSNACPNFAFPVDYQLFDFHKSVADDAIALIESEGASEELKAIASKHARIALKHAGLALDAPRDVNDDQSEEQRELIADGSGPLIAYLEDNDPDWRDAL
tara:strand:- start:5637 stop:6569 length:933 start_codon:yes stop_codon:yes gene_type:complete